jgi:molecular chaperone Hsp33
MTVPDPDLRIPSPGGSELHKFIFEGLPVRGMLVRLTDAWQEVLARRSAPGRAFPAPVRALLGEMAAAGTLMQANIKFKGSLILQIFGDGPVKLAVAEVQPDLAFRVTATVVGEVDDSARLEAMLNVKGQGRCAITLDPKGRLPGQQPYQGIVPLHGDRREPLQDLSAVLEHYMLQSEQLDTRLVLAADDRIAAGLLIQRLPVEGAGNLSGQGSRNEDEIGRNEAFNRIALLAATLTREELLTLDAETVLRRLFWEEDLRRFAPLRGRDGPRFECNCSRQRVGGMLKGLGREEIDGIVAERGDVEIGCEFCGRQYRFDPVDVGELFTPASRQMPGSGTLN